MGAAVPPAWQIAELPPAERGAAALWLAWRQRLRRRVLLARAIRKRRELRRLIDRTGQIRRGDILAVLCVRNEAVRLPFFLDHHRRLGVRQFLVIDNASSDGTAELLRAQPDVSLWQTAASYRAARYGVDWTNWLLMRHGHGHWCLTVDADELLVYPHWETRPLPALTRWLDSTGAQSLAAMMLELYPKARCRRRNTAPERTRPRSCNGSTAATTAFRCSPACATCGSRAARARGCSLPMIPAARRR
jgi:hypothetical protein